MVSSHGAPETAAANHRPLLTVSAVIPTRNRPAHALECARAILANALTHELVVVDQSDDSSTEVALGEIVDPRLRYVRCRLRGAASGRNTGIRATTGKVVAFTDDDCRAAPDWTESLLRIFASDPEAAVVCGQVRIPDELRKLGFASSFQPEIREWKGRYPAPDRDWGITANMSVRRDVFEKVGSFDPFLGAGTRLRSGEEPDFLFRVLKGGLKVVNAEEVIVDHLGIRARGEDAANLAKSYALGTAAAFFKYVRLGDPDGTAMYLRHLVGCGRLVLANMIRLNRPIGLGYALAFASGSIASLRYRVDGKRRLYSGVWGD
jgi:GT2 family glycosyltransferase